MFPKTKNESQQMFSFIDQEKRSTTGLSWPTKKKRTQKYSHTLKKYSTHAHCPSVWFRHDFLENIQKVQQSKTSISLLCLWHQDWRAKITSIFFQLLQIACAYPSIHPCKHPSNTVPTKKVFLFF